MHYKRHSLSPLLTMLIFLWWTLIACANESSQTSAPRERNSETRSSSSASNPTEPTSSDHLNQGNPLDNRESTTAKQARLVREAQACLDADKIKKVEVIITGNSIGDLEITKHYTSGTLFEDAKTLAKKVEEEIDPENPPTSTPRPPSEESSTTEGIKVTLYKKPVQSFIPSPIFKFSLTGANADNGINVDLDESTYPLLNGYAQKIEIPYEGSLGISDLEKVKVAKKKHLFQVTNLFTTTQVNEQFIKLEELYLRQILKVTLRVNGQKIYELEDVNHVISLHSGEDNKMTYNPEWADLNLSQNIFFQEYKKEFEECIAPLAN